jgi:TonB family protein
MKQAVSRNGLIGTIVFHAVILVLFLSFGLSVPLPLPSEQGIVIDYGQDASGLGDIEPAEAMLDKQVAQPQANPNSGEEENLTQNYEDAPSVDTKKEVKKVNTKTEAQTTQKNTQTPVNEAPKEVQKQVNKKALYPGKGTGTSGSQGVAGGNGNQGNPNGAANAQNYNNTNSSGNSTASYSLSGRNPVILPKPEYKRQIEGKVVVEITVDKQGNVTKAVAGARGSTTLDENLLEAAEKAAYKARFNVKTDAPALQKGTITYHFILQ